MVAVVSDGSAVLDWGHRSIGAMPVMEGKAVYLKFCRRRCLPICLDTKDVDEIVRTVELIALLRRH